MSYVVAQILCGLGALMGLGQAVKKDASKFDQVCGYVACTVFIAGIVIIQGVR